MWASAFSSQPLQPSAWARSLLSSTVTDFRGYPLRVGTSAASWPCRPCTVEVAAMAAPLTVGCAGGRGPALGGDVVGVGVDSGAHGDDGDLDLIIVGRPGGQGL
jgi:hypothetical protein